MSDIEVKTYRYLRMTIVVLLVGLGAAVFHQTWRHDFHILGSISAYYYTPVQGIFVGVLMAVGACMISLKGTTETEDVLLNYGGMAAAVVALVPTTRGEDFETAVHACQQGVPLLTEQAARGVLDCPTVQALAAATRANVENNMSSLLAIGGLGLLVAVVFVLVDMRYNGLASVTYLWGLGLAIVTWGAACVGLFVYPDWFMDNAHFIAAVVLFLCVFIVTIANALRRDVRESSMPLVFTNWTTAGRNLRGALFSWPLGCYAWVAWAMVAAVLIAGPLFLYGYITLFWLEVVLASLFIVFWLVQTLDLLADEIAGQQRRKAASAVPSPRPRSVQSPTG